METPEVTSTEVLIKELGGCGPFQVMLVISICVILAPMCLSHSFLMYGIYNPGWRCLDNTTYVTVNGTESTSVSPVGNNQTSDYLTDTCDGFEACQDIEFNPEASTLVTEWGLVCGRASILPAMISIEMAGSLVGMLLVGYIGDRYGRKMCIQIAVLMLFVLNIVSIFSVSWQMYSALGFLVGIACSFTAPADILKTEYVTPKWRIIVMSIPNWCVCVTMFAVAAMVTQDWQSLKVIICVLAAISFIILLWVPESLRWLSVVGKNRESLKVVRKISNINRAGIMPVNPVESSCEKNEMEGKNISWLLRLLRKDYKMVTFVIGFTFFSMDMIYYAITFGVSTLPGNIYTNMIISTVSELPANILSVFAAQLSGRKKPTFIFFILESMCLFGVVVVNVFANANAIATLVLIMAVKICLNACWFAIATVTIEVYPTAVRSKMMSYAHTMRLIGSVVSPYLIPSDPETFYISYLVMGVLTVVCAILILFIPETKGKPLQDV